MHLKRNSIPRTWPLQKKGTTYVTRTRDSFSQTIPLIIVIRDILKLAKTRKEVKAIVSSNKIKINGKTIKDEKYPLFIFDNLEIADKNFKVVFKNRKFSFEESKDTKKIVKIIGKKITSEGVQVNLRDGRNFLSKEKIEVGDSVLIDFKENKIAEILKFQEGCKIMFIRGKHLGEQGTAEKIENKHVVIRLKDEKINSNKENVIVVK